MAGCCQQLPSSRRTTSISAVGLAKSVDGGRSVSSLDVEDEPSGVAMVAVGLGGGVSSQPGGLHGGGCSGGPGRQAGNMIPVMMKEAASARREYMADFPARGRRT
jgi:hypothetical protein